VNFGNDEHPAMTVPLQTTFRHMPASRIFENRIRELARRLEKFSTHVTRCHVVIQKPHQRASQGALFDVHIDITVPDCVIAIRRSHADDALHADAYVALRDAFNAARRKLQDYERQRRGDVKTRAGRGARHSAAIPGSFVE
jgi:ribosome-associated translation inhibitor RaiA